MSTTPESQLAYLGFHLIPPSQALRPYVQAYWYFRRDAPLLAYQEEYMHPRGGFGVVFNFGDRLRLDEQVVAEPLFLDGTTTISRKLGFLGRIDLMGIRFHEGGAYPVLGIPLAELRNEIRLLDALDRQSLLYLYEQLYEADSAAMRVKLLDAWLMRRLSSGKEQSALIPVSLCMLREHGPELSIPQLARQLAVSQRHLERLFQSQVGMSPKQYTQLLRVESARLDLKRGHTPSMAYLAAELGYYDQSHFIREFSAVVGMTPYAYLSRYRQR
jgi:AraC-like DNA-binding protein